MHAYINSCINNGSTLYNGTLWIMQIFLSIHVKTRYLLDYKFKIYK